MPFNLGRRRNKAALVGSSRMGNCGGRKNKEPELHVERAPPSEIELAKKEELARVLNADKAPRKDGDAWFVVEAAWVHRWFAYIQGKDSVKRPGAIDNSSLLMYDAEAEAWKPKPLLRGARKEHMGHYRRVNMKVWELWSHSYEGSGPPIWVQKEPFEDTSNWQLDPYLGKPDAGGRSNKAGAEGQGEGGPGGALNAVGLGGSSAKRLYPPASETLEIGEMEDNRVGEETKAQAAAFFDYVPVGARTDTSLTDDRPGEDGGGVSAASGGGGAAVAPSSDPAGSDAAVSIRENSVSAGEPAAGTGGGVSAGAGVGEGEAPFGGRADAWMYGDGSE